MRVDLAAVWISRPRRRAVTWTRDDTQLDGQKRVSAGDCRGDVGMKLRECVTKGSWNGSLFWNHFEGGREG